MTILTPLTVEDFKTILTEYNIGSYKSHKHIPKALFNTVFELNTSKGKYVLKVYEYEIKSFIHYQVRLTSALIKQGVPVPENLSNKKSAYLIDYKNKLIGIQKFINGTSLTKKCNRALLSNVTKGIIALDKELLKLNFRGGDNWGYAHEFKRRKLKRTIDNFPIQEEYNRHLTELKANVNPKNLRRCIVHGDFTDNNFLVQGDKLLAIIDFDDAHRDYLVYDPAVFVYNTLVSRSKVYTENLKIFLKIYATELELNLDEKKAIYFFIRHRYLSSINSVLKQLEQHPDEKEEHMGWIRDKIKRYYVFSKISLKEFLNFYE
jgi:Ser/Thr protein kinase RdoA (MazF antagonist)